MKQRTVAVLAFDGMAPFELGIVVEVFGLPRPELKVPWYELIVCADPSSPIRTVGGLSLTAPHDLRAFAAADTVIVPGVSNVYGEVPEKIVAALRQAYENGARMVSICSGAFALAAAGLLDGREATTHWQYAAELQRRYPAVTVNPDVLYVDGGRVLTGAGSAAGLDVCLHLVRADHGAAIANAVARRLVVSPHRNGGQAQFIEAAVNTADADDHVGRSQQWALANLAAPITLADLARVANAAPRTYLRQFARQTGTTPIRWLIDQRVAASLPLLESGELAVEQVAAAVGFESPVTFRHHFSRAMRIPPSEYRRTFRIRS